MVHENLKRAKKSRIATQIERAMDEYKLTIDITVSESAPAKWPKLEGWKEVLFISKYNKLTIYNSKNYPGIVKYYQKKGYKHIHIKTATLGGQRKIWVK